MLTQTQVIAGFSNSTEAAEYRQEIAAEVSDLQFQKLVIDRRAETLSSRTGLISAQIAAVTAEIAGYNAIIPGLSGALLTDMQNKKTRAEYRLFTLQQRSASSGPKAVLELRVSSNNLQAQITHLQAEDGVIADVIALNPLEWN